MGNGDELLVALLKIVDPDHLLYGSDWPFTPIPAVEDAASGLDSTPLLNGDGHQAMMAANALRLFCRFGGQECLAEA